MLHPLLLPALATLLLAPVTADDTAKTKDNKDGSSQKADQPPVEGKKQDTAKTDSKPDKKLPPPKRRVGRPGDLTPEEEDKLDKVLDQFIAHDIGLRPNPKSLQALRDMGPEAIPALIRALNKTATMSHSCPVSMIQRKLATLLASSEDEEVLRYARAMIGSGVRRSPYEGLLTQLRVIASQRQAQLARLRQQQESQQKGAQSGTGSRYSKEDR
jgi:hypothetical protein